MVEPCIENYKNNCMRKRTSQHSASTLRRRGACAQVVKAEDARLLSNMGMMRRKYRALRDLNGDMVNEHEKRAMKQAKLLASLKEVNRFVQLAARLRHGEPKTSFIAACRKAIQQNNIDGFLKLFRDGK